MKENINVLISILGTIFTYLFGVLDTPTIVLPVMMVIDYLFGVMVATKNKNLSVEIGLDGVRKKVAMIMYVIVAVMLDRLLDNGNFFFRTSICMYLIGNEGLSIIKNGSKIGVVAPMQLLEGFQNLVKIKGSGENGEK